MQTTWVCGAFEIIMTVHGWRLRHIDCQRWDSRVAGRVARFLMMCMFLALTLTALVSSSAFASVGPDGPRLAVTENTLFPYRFDLTTVDETGAQPLRLAGGGPKERPLPEEYMPPSWSPDGSLIAFAALSGRLDEGPRAVRLYVSSSDGSDLRPLKGTRGAEEPKFAPDGRTVFFTRYRFRSRVNGRGGKEFVRSGASIWAVDVFNGSARRITPERNGVWMFPGSFSPDGESLLASRLRRRGSWSVVRIDLASGRVSMFLRRAAEPVYSPDGSTVAFVRWRSVHRRGGKSESRSDLFTVRSGGGGVRRVTSSSGGDYSQSWDPSGERLAFVRYLPEWLEPEELGFGSAVMQVNADGSCLGFVLRPSLDVAFFGVAWQPGPGREAGRIEC
jgi:Tol biopolymer transport system component